MPPTTPMDELDRVLGHPVTLIAVTLLAAWLVRRTVEEQVRRLRLDDDGGTFDWAALLAALAGWATLLLGLLGLATHRGWSALSAPLAAAFGGAGRLLLAAAVLLGAARLARSFAEPEADADAAARARARAEARTIHALGAALAVAAALGLSPFTALLLALLVIPLALVVRSPDHRTRAAALLDDLAAGLRLRGHVKAGATLEGGRVAGDPGPLRTWVELDGRRQLLRNADLLARVTAPSSPAA